MKSMIKVIIALLVMVAAAPCIHAKTSRKSDSYFRNRTVKLVSEHGLCSGEQVRAPSGVDYILSAWHCKDIADADGQIMVVTESGQKLKRYVLALDDRADLMLIEGLPNLPGLPIARNVIQHEHVRTYTHGGMLDTWRSDGEIIMDKEVTVGLDMPAEKCVGSKLQLLTPPGLPSIFGQCVMKVMESATTARIIPSSSGGMAVNDAGELIGVVSAGDSTGTGYLVRLVDIQSMLVLF